MSQFSIDFSPENSSKNHEKRLQNAQKTPFWKNVCFYAVELGVSQFNLGGCQRFLADEMAPAYLRENGLRLRARQDAMTLSSCAVWAPQEDLWSVLDELPMLLAPTERFGTACDWENAHVRRLWFVAPLKLSAVSDRVWRCWARHQSAQGIFWRRAGEILFLCCDIRWWKVPSLEAESQSTSWTLPILRRKRRDLISFLADQMRHNLRLAVKSEAISAHLHRSPYWLRAARSSVFAGQWQELGTALDLWAPPTLEEVKVHATLPDFALASWERKETPQKQRAA